MPRGRPKKNNTTEQPEEPMVAPASSDDVNSVIDIDAMEKDLGGTPVAQKTQESEAEPEEDEPEPPKGKQQPQPQKKPPQQQQSQQQIAEAQQFALAIKTFVQRAGYHSAGKIIPVRYMGSSWLVVCDKRKRPYDMFEISREDLAFLKDQLSRT